MLGHFVRVNFWRRRGIVGETAALIHTASFPGREGVSRCVRPPSLAATYTKLRQRGWLQTQGTAVVLAGAGVCHNAQLALWSVVVMVVAVPPVSVNEDAALCCFS